MANVPNEVALDMSGVKPFEPMSTKVTYQASISKCENEEIKGRKGSFQALVELTITAPEEVEAVDCTFDEKGKSTSEVVKTDKNGDPVMTKAKGRKLFRRYSYNPDALPFLHELVRASDPTKVLDENFIFKPVEYVGLAVGVKIENTQYEEQVRANAKRILPPLKVETSTVSKKQVKR